MRAFVWLIRAALFVLLFAFALNNQHEVHLNGFFGREWRGPMVFVVLAALGLGVGLGVLAMLPGWWRQRRAVQRADAGAPASPDTSALPPLPDVPLTQPSRDGL